MKFLFNLLFILCFSIQNVMAFSPKTPTVEQMAKVVEHLNGLNQSERMAIFDQFFVKRAQEDRQWYAKNRNEFKKSYKYSSTSKGAKFELEGKDYEIEISNLKSGKAKLNGHEFNFRHMSMPQLEIFFSSVVTPKTSFLKTLFINEAHAEAIMVAIFVASAALSFLIGCIATFAKWTNEDIALSQLKIVNLQCRIATKEFDLNNLTTKAPVASSNDLKEKLAEMDKLKNKIKIFTRDVFDKEYGKTASCVRELISKIEGTSSALDNSDRNIISKDSVPQNKTNSKTKATSASGQ